MPLKDAELFIKEIAVNNELRKSLYKYETSAEIKNAIVESGYSFELYEFEESINHLKSESPTEEQAIMIDELLMWWNMLMFDGTVPESGSVNCSPAKCASCSGC